MKLLRFTVNPFSANCYIYFDENSGNGVIIDPAAYSVSEQNFILSAVRENNINITHILNTHGHIDHVLGNGFAKDEFKAPVLIHKDDLFLLQNTSAQGRFFGLEIGSPPDPDEFIDEESIVRAGTIPLRFIHTPGHSPGSVCIIDDKNKIVFCGDLIFNGSVGRTDLQGGDMNVLLDSIRNKLFESCSDEYTLLPGHMEQTDIASEKKFNPFLN